MSDSLLQPANPATQTTHVGTYRRVLPVSLDRMFENTLDWEHLPWQHASSFSAIECEDAGDWGWRARVNAARDGAESTIELRFDRTCGRWVTSNLAGANLGAEIWTYAWPRAEREIEVIVDFFVPGVAPEYRDRVGAAYARSYATLYDEDEAMMVGRQRELDQRFDRSDAPKNLGAADRLDLAAGFEWHGRRWRLTEVNGALEAHSAACPHQLGPLERRGNELFCPWHGYRFDPISGACLTGQSCRLPAPPRITIEAGEVWVHPPA